MSIKDKFTVAALVNHLYAKYRSLDLALAILDLTPDQAERDEILTMTLTQFEDKFGVAIQFSLS